jgi:hypothetical protein
VGVQLLADIKSFYRDKTVVPIHSRDQLLLNFGMRLHEFVVGRLGVLGVDVWLGERPAVPVDGNWESAELTIKCGRSEMFDLVVCILTNQSCYPDTSGSLVQDKAKLFDCRRIFSIADIDSNEKDSCQANLAA